MLGNTGIQTACTFRELMIYFWRTLNFCLQITHHEWNCIYQATDLIGFPIAVSLQNALLPAGLRQKDQTTKQPTGKFNRDSLLKYLEKEALEYKDREDIVPYTGEKKGVFLRHYYYIRHENINSLDMK